MLSSAAKSCSLVEYVTSRCHLSVSLLTLVGTIIQPRRCTTRNRVPDNYFPQSTRFHSFPIYNFLVLAPCRHCPLRKLPCLRSEELKVSGCSSEAYIKSVEKFVKLVSLAKREDLRGKQGMSKLVAIAAFRIHYVFIKGFDSTRGYSR